ncbi:MAG: formylmethanofuran dehydrogenase [Planctomycetaceae bacterium]|nr:formylmethanofuran dehydrogenase [Planctomycetaceae bacterium]|tara:strand:+ start:300 stop:656 length:357 start_codon:yes stop_codon:yes gene_type:complete
MSKTYIMIPGRTSQQGVGINEGKFEETYQNEISVLQVSLEDMEELGLEAGDWVRVKSEHGEIEIKTKAAKKGELPAGLLFIAYGDYSSRLMGADTHGSGMPTSKGFDVTMEKIATPSE